MHHCLNHKSIAKHLYDHRLQTGMRGAFGKPLGTVSRVHIGQPIMSVRAPDRYKAQVIEALRRAKFKFPGRQKVRVRTLLITLHLAGLRSLNNFLLLSNRFLCQKDGDLLNSNVTVMNNYVMMVVLLWMVPMLSTDQNMVRCMYGKRHKPASMESPCMTLKMIFK